MKRKEGARMQHPPSHPTHGVLVLEGYGNNTFRCHQQNVQSHQHGDKGGRGGETHKLHMHTHTTYRYRTQHIHLIEQRTQRGRRKSSSCINWSSVMDYRSTMVRTSLCPDQSCWTDPSPTRIDGISMRTMYWSI